jgi:ATP-binding cassette subfamily B (MDR/TAP) protein 1
MKGFKVGLGNGVFYGALFAVYALGFWYGARLVADSIESKCVAQFGRNPDCISGGMVSAVFFCVVMGSFSLGLVGREVQSKLLIEMSSYYLFIICFL